MMKTLWELYGCQVIDFQDKGSEFYNKMLIKNIEDELKNLPDVKMFVFALSSHGEEREEKNIHDPNDKKYEHYFFTKDGNYSTQKLMNDIANSEKLQDKLKIFLIQACRSRASGENEDEGYEFETTSTQVQPHDGKDRADAKGIPSEEDTSPNDGIDKPDAKGYMPPPEEDEVEVVPVPTGGMSNASSASPVTQPSPTDLEKHIDGEQISPIDEEEYTMQTVPHCDDCIVMFASTSGKYAYSKSNSQLSGGWLLKAIEDVLKRHKDEEKVHIFDIMTEVNREVGMKEAKPIRNVTKMKEFSEDGNPDNLKKQLKDQIKSLKLAQEDNLSRVAIRECKEDLSELSDRINQTDTKDNLLKIRDEVLSLAQLSTVILKAQSNFFHNLAFDEEDLYLCKNKTETNS